MIQEQLESKLRGAFAPVELVVENESHMHSVAPGSETHFKVLLVSPSFEGLSRVERHRRVHAVVEAELAGGVHAFSVRAMTPAEWERDGAADFVSPRCLGGSKAG